MLNSQQVDHFKTNGYVIVENAVRTDNVNSINAQIDKWVHESRIHSSNYGRLIDGQPRFDLEPGHTKTNPKLRRITNPIEVSEELKRTVLTGTVPQLLTPILGPNIKFDHCKINAKYPGMTSECKYHQDHAFEPQTNDSVLVALLMLDDTTVENGCLKIVPGSHKTKFSHFENGIFNGRVSDSLVSYFDSAADNIEAKAGSLCLMDTWAVHGSASNSSLDPRRLLITEYKAADAFPMTRHKLPSRYMDSVILGEEPAIPRYRDKLDFDLPPDYDGDSLFDLQDIVAEGKQESHG